MKKITLYLNIALLILLFSSCGRGEDDTIVHIHKTEFSEEDQSKIGTEIHNFINQQPMLFPMLERSANQAVYDYLTTLVHTLINTEEITTRHIFDWEVSILQDDQERTAFSAPGGKIFISTGLLKFLKGENELVSVLAHEISYIESGKVIDNLQSQYEDQLLLGDVLLGNANDDMDELCLFLKNMSYSESEVLEADNFSIDLICPFQYNAHGIKTIIEEANQTSTSLTWLDNRPSASNRVENIINKSAACGDEEDPTFEERYKEYKNLLP